MSGSETPTSLRSYSSFRSQSSFRRYRTSDVNVRTSGGRTFATSDPSSVLIPPLPNLPNSSTLGGPTCNHLSLSEHHPLHVSRKTSPEVPRPGSRTEQQHSCPQGSSGRSSGGGKLEQETSCII